MITTCFCCPQVSPTKTFSNFRMIYRHKPVFTAQHTHTHCTCYSLISKDPSCIQNYPQHYKASTLIQVQTRGYWRHWMTSCFHQRLAVHPMHDLHPCICCSACTWQPPRPHHTTRLQKQTRMKKSSHATSRPGKDSHPQITDQRGKTSTQWKTIAVSPNPCMLHSRAAQQTRQHTTYPPWHQHTVA